MKYPTAKAIADASRSLDATRFRASELSARFAKSAVPRIDAERVREIIADLDGPGFVFSAPASEPREAASDAPALAEALTTIATSLRALLAAIKASEAPNARHSARATH